MKLQIKKATTDVTLYVFIQDSSSTTGAGLTGLAYNTASLTCYYVRPLGTAAQLTLATQTVTGAHSDGGFVEVSSTNLPGVYRLDLSDAVCATGVNSVVVMLKGAANMAPVVLEIELVAYDPQSATDLGLSRIDAAVSTRASQASLDTLDDYVDSEVASILSAVDTEVAAIKAKTDNLPSDPADASVVAGLIAAVETKVDTIDTNVDAILVDTAEIGAAGAGLTALATQTSVDTIDDFLDTEVASILSAVDTEVAAIKAKTDNLPSDPADASDIASSFTAVNTKLDTIDDFLDTEIAAIKAKTDHITPKTGLTITATRSIDGAAFGACANSAAELSNGIYVLDLAAADLNGDIITFKFTAAGADARYITIKTNS
jgi:hypothetical protein